MRLIRHHRRILSLTDGTCESLFIVGVFSAGWLLPSSSFSTLPEHLQVFLDDYDITMPSMPQLDFSAEWERFKSNIPEPWKLANDGREFQVGEEMKSRGLEAKYPVILVPGIISTVSPLGCYFICLSDSLFRAWNLGQQLQSSEDSSGRKFGAGSLWFLRSRSTKNGGWPVLCLTQSLGLTLLESKCVLHRA